MAAGDKMFSTAGVETVKFENKPITAGEYQGKLQTKNSEIGKRPEPGKFPYVSYRIEVLDTKDQTGTSKNHLLFEMLFTGLNPGKDGKLNPHRANQLVGLVKALGAGDVDLPTVSMKDEHGNDVQCISATHLLAWLKANDGAIVRIKVKTQKGTNGYSDKSVVDQFIESDSAMPEGFGEQTEQEVLAETAEETQYVDEDGNPVNEDGSPIETKPAPKPVAVKKAAPLKAVASGKRGR